jgi:hypothetical protein
MERVCDGTHEGKPYPATILLSYDGDPSPDNPRIPTLLRRSGILANRTPEYPSKHKYCNNCHKYGHPYHQCKMPITSYGLIVFRKRPVDQKTELDYSHRNDVRSFVGELGSATLDNGKSSTNVIEYLMIRRRDTLGFIDFMRGKYSVYDKSYILNMMVQMTILEKTRLLTQPFGDIWRELWGGEPVSLNMQYRNEEQISRDKFNTLRSGVLLKHDFYTLETLIQSSKNDQKQEWEFAEWGFPKGRRNYQEKDYDCAVREFCEETGYTQCADKLVSIQNIMPFEEIFTGSNYKSYKHKYYLTYMPYEESIRECAVQSSEVSCSEWKTYEDCMSSIRYYNVEKKRILENVHQTILRYL